MKHKNHDFNKFIIHINMYLSKPEFDKIWGASQLTDALWTKYDVVYNRNFLSFYANLDDNNRDALIDYLIIKTK